MEKYIRHIAGFALSQIEAQSEILRRIKKSLPKGVYEMQVSQLSTISGKIKGIISDPKKDSNPNELFENLRVLISEFAASMISSDYQSPSYMSSQYSQAGSQTGKILATLNDYKRDINLDEHSYEESFRKEYIDAKFKPFIRSFMTSSGMSAFTTILTYLITDKKISRILCGSNSYFQYREILDNLGGVKIRYFREDDPDNFCSEALRFKPSCVFLDSLTNSSQVFIPDTAKMISCLEKNRLKTYLIIDNTCMSIFLQPFMNISAAGKLRVIVFESLIKYHHFGLDRATGGIIVCGTKDAEGIFRQRKNTGSNIPDYNVYCYPKPSRKLLHERMSTLSDNAKTFYKDLERFVYSEKTPLEKLIFPYNEGFCGSFIVLRFKKAYRSVSFYKRFIAAIISSAKKEGIMITAGTSFGMNTTRIMLTSLWTDYGEPFIRISLGTEDRMTVYSISNVFKTVLRKSNSPLPEIIAEKSIFLKRKLGLGKYY